MKREPSFLLDDSRVTAPSPSGKKMVGRRKGSLLFMLFVVASMMLIAPAMADTVAVESDAARGGAIWEEMEALKVDKADSAIPSTTAEKDTNLRGSFEEQLSAVVGIGGITNRRKNMAVDLYAGNTNNRSKVGLFRHNNSWNQQWRIYSDGTIRPALDLNKCLEAGGNPSKWTKLFIWKCNGTLHQKWNIYTDGRIKNRSHNYFIGVEYCGERNSKRLELRNYDHGSCGEAQKWNFFS